VKNTHWTIRRTIGDAGSTHGCGLIATSFPGGKTGTRRWLLKAMDVVERRTTSSRENMKLIKNSLR
jgi:hypothetical protein